MKLAKLFRSPYAQFRYGCGLFFMSILVEALFLTFKDPQLLGLRRLRGEVERFSASQSQTKQQNIAASLEQIPLPDSLSCVDLISRNL